MYRASRSYHPFFLSIFIGITLFHAFGAMMVWSLKVMQAKSSAEYAIAHTAEKALTTLKISQQVYQNQRIGKKEIRLNGQLFDIKSMQIIGDSIQLMGYHDAKEEALMDQFAIMMGAKNYGASPLHLLLIHLADFFASLFISTFPTFRLFPPTFTNRAFCLPHSLYNQTNGDVENPPPIAASAACFLETDF